MYISLIRFSSPFIQNLLEFFHIQMNSVVSHSEKFKVGQRRGERADSQRCERFSWAFCEARVGGQSEPIKHQRLGGFVMTPPSVSAARCVVQETVLKERGAWGTLCDRNELKCRAGMCKFTAGEASQNSLIVKVKFCLYYACSDVACQYVNGFFQTVGVQWTEDETMKHTMIFFAFVKTS